MKKIVIILLLLTLTTSWCQATPPVSQALAIQHWQTSHGTPVYFVPSTNLPMLSIALAFTAGSAYDKQQWGLAALTNNMLDEGTTELSSDQIAQHFANVGAIYSNFSDRDMATICLTTLTEPKAQKVALNTFTQILGKANFPSNSLQRIQQQTLTAITSKQQDPSALAEDAFYTNLYGKHVYAHPVLGIANSVSTIKQTDVLHFYQQYYVAKNATLALVGNISRIQAEALAEQLTSVLPAGNAATSVTLAAEPNNNAQIISYPSPQTQIILGTLGITPTDPDRYALAVGNYILGGSGLTSRLANIIRNQHGLAYHVSSQFIPNWARGPFSIVLSTRTAQSQQALKLTQATLQTFLTDGPSMAEVNEAKQNIIASFPLRFDSNQGILQSILMLGFYHLPLNYYDNYRTQINAVTLPQIRAAFNKTINMKSLVTVLVEEKSKAAK